MHLSTFLTLAATASSFAVTPAVARLDRRSSSHRGSVDHHNLTKRLAHADPAPFRSFAKENGASAPVFFEREGVVALRQKRDEGDDLIAQIGDVVQEVAVAWKLAVPEDHHVLAASTSTSTSTEDADAAAAAAAEAEKKKQEEEAAAAAQKKKEQEEAAAKKKAAALKKQKALAAKAAADKKAAEEAAAAKAKAEAEAAAKQKAAEAAAAAKRKAAAAAARKKAQEEAAAEKQAEEAAAAAAQQKAQEEAAAKKAQEEAAANKAAAAKAAAAKKVADTSSASNTKLAVVDTSKATSLIGFKSENCGASGATDEHPNGSQDFLNCGISKSNPSSGWTPPKGVTLATIKTVSVEHALATNDVWAPCSKYIDIFDKVAKDTGLPAILLASFALQESTCNADCMGGGGEVGLMQITPDKCGGRSTAACRDPEFNVRTAAQYFKQELDNQGGAFLNAIGAYNGWQTGMSYNSATAAAKSGCCTCQNNLDYIFQMANGWLIGKTGYELGSYHNLKVCGYQE